MKNIHEITIDDPVILIRVAGLFREDMTPEELYHATRSSWLVSPVNANKAQYAFSINEGVVQEVYQIDGWNFAGMDDKNPDRKRYEFTGKIAENSVRNKYLYQSIKHYFKKGNRRSFMYLNVK